MLQNLLCFHSTKLSHTNNKGNCNFSEFQYAYLIAYATLQHKESNTTVPDNKTLVRDKLNGKVPINTTQNTATMPTQSRQL